MTNEKQLNQEEADKIFGKNESEPDGLDGIIQAMIYLTEEIKRYRDRNQ